MEMSDTLLEIVVPTASYRMGVKVRPSLHFYVNEKILAIGGADPDPKLIDSLQRGIFHWGSLIDLVFLPLVINDSLLLFQLGIID